MILKTPSRRTMAAVAAMAFVLAFSTVGDASHSWGNYHWARSSNPLSLNVGDNVSAAWDAYLNEAIADWNQSNVIDLTKVAGGTRPKNCRPTAGRIEACSERYGNNGWLGIAQIWASGSHITQAITKLNDYYFNQAQYNTPAWRRLVTCQEIAHDFGLNHQDETFDNPNLGSCMDYTNDPDGGAGGASSNDPSNEHPNQHDFDQLQTIYGHLDAGATAGAATSNMPPAANDIALDGPAQWGRLVASTNGGLTEVYVADFGGGKRVFTFVTWTLERAGRHHAE